MPETARQPVENTEYAAFLRRAIRAYTRRITTGDIEALTDLTQLAHELQQATAQAVTGLHHYGYSWAEIATRLGVTRQAAQQRFGQTNSHRGGNP
jgi:DNA-directed RNA polymerase specialized sigma24 family protein